MECLTFNSIRHIISLQWTLKVKDILPVSTSVKSDKPLEVSEKTIGSIQCQIKGIEGLIFSLELTNQLEVLAKGHNRWLYQFIYAFAVVEDRAFLVKKSDKLIFLDYLKFDHLLSVEEITFHCMVLVGTAVADSTTAESDLADYIKEVPSKRQVCADVESIGYPHCEFDGKIPEFTVDKAKELIANEGTSSVLKILAMEYLVKCITVDSVSDILKIAVHQDLKNLTKRCSEFLSECIIKRRKLSHSSSSDSSDF